MCWRDPKRAPLLTTGQSGRQADDTRALARHVPELQVVSSQRAFAPAPSGAVESVDDPPTRPRRRKTPAVKHLVNRFLTDAWGARKRGGFGEPLEVDYLLERWWNRGGRSLRSVRCVACTSIRPCRLVALFAAARARHPRLRRVSAELPSLLLGQCHAAHWVGSERLSSYASGSPPCCLY